jgi:hypothetical protein
VPDTLPVEDVQPNDLTRWAMSSELGWMLQGLWKSLISQSVSLDGAWAIWQRPGN